MEERKSKNKIIAAFAVMISIMAGLFATLFCLPAKNSAFAAETFNPANVSKAYKVAEVGDYLDKLYIRNTPNSVEFYFKKNTTENFVYSNGSGFKCGALSFPLLRMTNSINDKTVVYASCTYGNNFYHYLVIMDTTKYDEQRSKWGSAFSEKNMDDGYFCLWFTKDPVYADLVDKLEDYEAYDLSSSANIHTIDLSERYQIFQSYDWVTAYETANAATLEPSMAISLHNLLFVEDPDYVEPDPGTGGSSGGSGSQGGNDNNTPKFTLDKVGYICIGVTAISAAVVIILNRRKKNKTKE